jgi:6-phosphofructokinase 2
MTQAPILTVTMNPALDLAADAPRVLPGPKLRCTTPQVEPGGGGVNVSRAIAALGGQSRALVALGGAVGQELAALLSAQGVEFRVMEAPGTTRQSLSVTDLARAEQYRFVLPGPVWDIRAQAAALTQIDALLGPGTHSVLSGSQPPGLTQDFALQVVRLCARRGAMSVVDTSGEPLVRLVREGGADVLRMDHAESEALAGRDLRGRADTLAYARALVADGAARMVVLACGTEGNVLVTAHEALSCHPPPVEVISKVGAGDSFTGAFVLALARGAAPAEALRQGTAAAAAAVTTPGSALCRADDVARLAPFCEIQSHVS